MAISAAAPLDERHFLLESRNGAEVSMPAAAAPDAVRVTSLNQAVEALEARLIDAALAQAEGNKARAAALLDISERTLWYKLKKLRPDQEGA